MTDAPLEPLTPLRDAGKELSLRKLSWRKGLHELRADEVLVGRLDIRAWSGAAGAEAAEGVWRFDRPRGMSQRRVRILTEDGETELATYLRDGWGRRRGSMECDGHSYELRGHGLWKTRWRWTGDGTELAELWTTHGFGDERGRITLLPAACETPHASLLALLGAHLALLSDRESAAASASASGGGSG